MYAFFYGIYYIAGENVRARGHLWINIADCVLYILKYMI